MVAAIRPAKDEPIRRADQLWSETQIKVIAALTDAVVPSLSGAEAADFIASLPPTASQTQKDLVADFAAEGFTTNPALLDKWARQACASLSPATRGDISLLLTALGTRAGCLALTGHFGPYYELTRPQREAAIHSWANSPITLLRKGAAGIRGLTLLTFYRANPTAWKAIGYADGANTDWQQAAEEDVAQGHYDYTFENEKIKQIPANAEVTVETEVLIIGSGSGGGVAASYLSKRGLKCLVVDKGIYLHPRDMRGNEDEGYTSLYDGEGIIPTEDGSLNVLAGSTFGGGTTINWSASLKPRHYARQAWADKLGLPYYLSPAFTNDLNAVCNRMGVAIQPIKHNVGNSLLALGAQRMGNPVEAVPQNSGGHTHYCGKCQFGCISGHKQGGTVTWLKDCAENGGSFMTETYIDRIIFDKHNRRKAVGAIGWVDGRKVTIKASKAVIVASGSIQTPAILLRTPELKSNKMIGKTLHLHPTTIVTGFYDFPVKPWEGSLLTIVVNGSELVDPEGWGAKIEVIASSPGIHAAFNNFSSAAEHKKSMLRYSHSYTMIVLTRDRDPGEVVLDAEGNARMKYSVSKHDQESAKQGILRACDIHMMAGASQISTAQVGVLPFKPKLKAPPRNEANKVYPESTTIPSTYVPVASPANDLSDPAYIEWRAKVAKVGGTPYYCSYGSAHQMASCRRAATPKLGACDPEGHVWGTQNLWVADASSIPTSSGVNPMITTMATAWDISRHVAMELGVEDDPVELRQATAVGGGGIATARL